MASEALGSGYASSSNSHSLTNSDGDISRAYTHRNGIALTDNHRMAAMSPNDVSSSLSQGAESNSPSTTTDRTSESPLANSAATKVVKSPRRGAEEASSDSSRVASGAFKIPTTNEGLLEVFGNGAFRCKIADLGNACWTYKHFTEDVQTRHYRAPEVIVGYRSYDTAIDVWSLGCVVFELLTGDLLFDPHSGKNYTKDDDHLAQIMELLGRLPRELVTQGKYSSDYLTRAGDLRNIKTLRFWGLKEVLTDKYKFNASDAANISNFLLPMLEYMPSKRCTARDRLRHPWLKDVDVNSLESCFNER